MRKRVAVSVVTVVGATVNAASGAAATATTARATATAPVQTARPAMAVSGHHARNARPNGTWHPKHVPSAQSVGSARSAKAARAQARAKVAKTAKAVAMTAVVNAAAAVMDRLVRPMHRLSRMPTQWRRTYRVVQPRSGRTHPLRRLTNRRATAWTTVKAQPRHRNPPTPLLAKAATPRSTVDVTVMAANAVPVGNAASAENVANVAASALPVHPAHSNPWKASRPLPWQPAMARRRPTTPQRPLQWRLPPRCPQQRLQHP